MLRIPFLRNILLVSVFFATIFPLYNLLYTIPAYQKLLIHETERETARFVRFLVSSNYLDQYELSVDGIPSTLLKEIRQLRKDGRLVKLRIFSPTGEILFSSATQEIGNFNNKKYFKEFVAKGQLYSKMVKKESITAEGVRTDRDLVETYVPIMKNAHFNGAMEVYSDVTNSQNKQAALSHQSFFTIISAAAGLLLMTLLVLFRARESIDARASAEAALHQANVDLEDRVDRRTVELSSTNQLLAEEVAERKRAQLAQKDAFVAISEARDRIEAIISSVADALLVTDHKNLLVLLNAAAAELFGVKADEVVGCRLSDVIGYDELLLEISKARSLLRGHESIVFDFEMNATDGNRVYQVRASRLLKTAVNGRGLILLIHDVTRERQVDRMKSEFVSMAAHELQTPLTMIHGYSELLLDPNKHFEPNDQYDFLKIINDKAIELSSLVDDILEISRVEDGRGMKLNFSQVQVGELCQQLICDLEGAGLKNQFTLGVPDCLSTVNADAARLKQVLENLLGNAIKYSPDGGPIHVELGREENWLKLEIIDQGIGMTEDEIENAFERFYRGDASNTAVRGTGLGLSIVRYIVDAHGGRIEIFSNKGQGTCIKVLLPLVN